MTNIKGVSSTRRLAHSDSAAHDRNTTDQVTDRCTERCVVQRGVQAVEDEKPHAVRSRFREIDRPIHAEAVIPPTAAHARIKACAESG